MLVNIKKLHKDAVVPFKAHEDDFCYDMVAVSEEEIAPNVWKYGLGVAIQCDYGDPYDNQGFKIFPRSSVWKTGMVLSNCTGIIDEGYTGEISAVFYHVMPNMPRYKVGDRVCQMALDLSEPLEFDVVDELEETERGDGGYGSTGK